MPRTFLLAVSLAALLSSSGSVSAQGSKAPVHPESERTLQHRLSAVHQRQGSRHIECQLELRECLQRYWGGDRRSGIARLRG